MNKSGFIQGFAFVLFATTAVTSFGTEPQKDPQEKKNKNNH